MWTVIVGNIGTVCDTESESEARTAYSVYCGKAQLPYGRAAGESVFLMRDDEIVSEHESTYPHD